MKTKASCRSLLMSALSLLMCISMLIGSTFAWFTDEVTSGRNTIQSGNLDVVMQYWDGDSYEDVTKNTKLFNDNALWEPGYTEVTYLKISNAGSLALKYQLAVNVFQETLGKTKDYADIKLSDHLQFKVVTSNTDLVGTYTTREAAQNADATATNLQTYTSDVTSLAVANADKTNDYFDFVALIIYMPETVRNEANHNGKDIPQIEMGVSLYATQDTVEYDSFNNLYDQDAWIPDITVSTASELAAAIAAVKDGGVISLSDNLTFDVDSAYTLNGYKEGLYYEGDKSFTIDLNGKTITNDSAVNDYLMLFKNNGEKANTITFKNGTIEASSSAYCAICTSQSSTQQITINLEDVNVIGNNSYGSVIKVRGGTVLNVNDGTTIIGTDSYLGIENIASTVNIYDGAEIYMNGTTSYNGCMVGVGSGGVANVYGGYGKGVKGGFIAMTTGGTINVEGGEWIANTDGTYANGNASVLIAQSNKQYTTSVGNSVVNVYGGTFKGGYNCYGDAVGDAQLHIYGGNFNADPSAYVANGYTAIANADGTYTIITGSSVKTATDLKTAMAAGGTIYVQEDITLAEDYRNIVIKDVDCILDLQGHTITATNAPLFNSKTNVTVQNGTFEMEMSSTGACKAPIAASAGTLTLKNVTINITTQSGVTGVRGTCLNVDDCIVNLEEGTKLNVNCVDGEMYAVSMFCYSNNAVLNINGAEINVTGSGSASAYAFTTQGSGYTTTVNANSGSITLVNAALKGIYSAYEALFTYNQQAGFTVNE